MKPKPWTLSVPFREVAKGFRELHRLFIEGMNDSPEADAVRDAMDAPWLELTEAEQARASGLSEDLYSLSDPASDELPAMNPQAQSKLGEAYEARLRGEWDVALHLLRRWGKFLPPALVSYFRGSVWALGGDLETAVLFYAHAHELDPQNGSYLGSYLYNLSLIDPELAKSKSGDILDHADSYALEVIPTAAGILILDSRDPIEGTSVLPRVTSALRGTLSRIDQSEEEMLIRSIRVTSIALLGYACHLSSDIQGALACYSSVLQDDPDDVGMLILRGLLLYGTSPRSTTDLERAVALGSQYIWPYYFLSHHLLIGRRYDECRAMCERASYLSASNGVRSELAEWKGIAQAELDFPKEIVRTSFEFALRLDPSNDRARRNLAIYEKGTESSSQRIWEYRRETLVRETALPGILKSSIAARLLPRAA